MACWEGSTTAGGGSLSMWGANEVKGRGARPRPCLWSARVNRRTHLTASLGAPTAPWGRVAECDSLSSVFNRIRPPGRGRKGRSGRCRRGLGLVEAPPGPRAPAAPQPLRAPEAFSVHRSSGTRDGLVKGKKPGWRGRGQRQKLPPAWGHRGPALLGQLAGQGGGRGRFGSWSRVGTARGWNERGPVPPGGWGPRGAGGQWAPLGAVRRSCVPIPLPE